MIDLHLSHIERNPVLNIELDISPCTKENYEIIVLNFDIITI